MSTRSKDSSDLETAIGMHIDALVLFQEKRKGTGIYQAFDLQEIKLHADAISRLANEINHNRTGRTS